MLAHDGPWLPLLPPPKVSEHEGGQTDLATFLFGPSFFHLYGSAPLPLLIHPYCIIVSGDRVPPALSLLCL